MRSSGDEIIILKDLHNHNFFITIDDFGSNTISLNSFLQCTVDAIKLDPSLISRAQASPEAHNLLQGIVALCQTQKILIIAEGIETDSDYEYLRSLNIFNMQGHYFTKPLPAEDVKHFIDTFKTH